MAGMAYFYRIKSLSCLYSYITTWGQFTPFLSEPTGISILKSTREIDRLPFQWIPFLFQYKGDMPQNLGEIFFRSNHDDTIWGWNSASLTRHNSRKKKHKRNSSKREKEKRCQFQMRRIETDVKIPNWLSIGATDQRPHFPKYSITRHNFANLVSRPRAIVGGLSAPFFWNLMNFFVDTPTNQRSNGQTAMK